MPATQPPSLNQLRPPLLLLALLLSACAHGAQLVPEPGVVPHQPVPTVRARMVQLALDEWQLFGQARWQPSEKGPQLLRDEPAPNEATRLSRVMLYWYAATDKPLFGHRGELRAWSAAFLTWLARSSGMTVAQWPASVLHWDAMALALDAPKDARFIAKDRGAHAPQPGDVLCAPRATAEDQQFAETVRDLATLRRGAHHCELVVAVEAGKLQTIGGNVQDTVARSEFDCDAQGHVQPTRERPWVLVLVQQDQPWPR